MFSFEITVFVGKNKLNDKEKTSTRTNIAVFFTVAHPLIAYFSLKICL